LLTYLFTKYIYPVFNKFNLMCFCCITSSLYLAWSTRVSSSDVRTGTHLEAQRTCLIWSTQQLHSVQIRRHTGGCLSCLPGCTCSIRVWTDQAAAVRHSRPAIIVM